MSHMSRNISCVHTHEQSIPSDSWVIQHNLGYYPIVDVFIMMDGVQVKMMPMNIQYTDVNMCTVSFSKEFTGVASVS